MVQQKIEKLISGVVGILFGTGEYAVSEWCTIFKYVLLLSSPAPVIVIVPLKSINVSL